MTDKPATPPRRCPSSCGEWSARAKEERRLTDIAIERAGQRLKELEAEAGE